MIIRLSENRLIIITAFFFLLLSGCSTSSFDCPHTAGVSCQSLEQINRQIDAGSLPLLALAHKDRTLC